MTRQTLYVGMVGSMEPDCITHRRKPDSNRDNRITIQTPATIQMVRCFFMAFFILVPPFHSLHRQRCALPTPAVGEFTKQNYTRIFAHIQVLFFFLFYYLDNSYKYIFSLEAYYIKEKKKFQLFLSFFKCFT